MPEKYLVGTGKPVSQAPRWKTWTIVQIPRSGTLKVWPITSVPFYVVTHYLKTTQICVGPSCPHCPSIPQRRAFYLPCLRVPEPSNVVVQVTEELVGQINAKIKTTEMLQDVSLTLARSGSNRFSPTKLVAIEPSTLPARTHSIKGAVESVLRLIGTPAEDISELALALYDEIDKGSAIVKAEVEKAKGPSEPMEF